MFLLRLLLLLYVLHFLSLLLFLQFNGFLFKVVKSRVYEVVLIKDWRHGLRLNSVNLDGFKVRYNDLRLVDVNLL